jgi:hypothetical protein
MNKLGALAACAVLALAGCGSSTPARSSVGTVKPAAAPPVTAAQAGAGLRAAVQAYSDAYLSGQGKVAWGLLSARCQKIYPLEMFSSLTNLAKTVYGGPLRMTSFKAHVAEGMARVTYTYVVPAINQTDQPWTLEAGGWRDDNC